MTAFANHFSFEFRTTIRNRSLLLLNYLFPLGFYLMAGALLTGLNPNFRDSLIPAMVFFTIMTSTLLGIPDPLVTAREAGIFRSYKIHGIPLTSILIIPVLTTVIHAAVTSAIIAITAPILFQATLPANGLSLVLAFIVMAFACASLGLLIGVIAPSSQATVLLGQAVFLPSMIVGGMMFPSYMLPEALSKVALLMPSTHAMNIVNGWVPSDLLSINPYVSVGVLFAGGALALGLALYLFNWDSQNKSRRVKPALALIALLPYMAGVLPSLV